MNVSAIRITASYPHAEVPGSPPIHTETTSGIPEGSISLASFNELVLAHQDAAFNFACYILGDADLAEDVTQRAFINAYHNIHQFQGNSFRAWLFKIIKNACLDEFRRPSYRKNTSLEALERDAEWRQIPEDMPDPEQVVEAIECSQRIQAALTHVEEPFRTVLILVDIQEMEYREAAQVLGAPVGTVKSRLARARQQFRRAYSLAI
jgi:RNA polymerase sigma-70 factor (ECF subfamily)